VKKAQEEAAEHNKDYFDEDHGGNSPEDFWTLLVIEGHHNDHSDGEGK